MEWQSWASVPFTQCDRLPAKPGIYVVVDATADVWYVGRAINLKARWNGRGHHRYKQLSRSNNQRSYSIYWQSFPPEQLNAQELHYIQLFKPHLNYSRVKKYARKALQPNDEISRILKVINKNTMLFPTIRSVVLGYYTEVEEDEESGIDEYICIVVVVTVNDYDGTILRSVQKSLSRRGTNLKGCWQTYESNCGSDSPETKPALIPAFIIGNVVYEFICFSNLITKLENDPSILEAVELEKQTVLALKDTNALPSLIVDDGLFSMRSEDYVRYRASDLQPLQQLIADSGLSSLS